MAMAKMTDGESPRGVRDADQGAADAVPRPAVSLVIAGFALFWAASFALLFSDVFAPEPAEPTAGFLMRMVMLIGFGGVQLLSCTRFPDVVDTRPRRMLVRFLSCGILAVLATLPLLPFVPSPEGLALQGALWLLLGAGMGEFLALWGVEWSGVDAERDANSFCSMAICASVVGAALLCAMMLVAPRRLSLAVGVGFFVLSAVIQQLCDTRTSPAEPISVEASRGKLNLLGASLLTPAAAAFGFGVALALNGLRLGAAAAFSTALSGIGAGAIAMLVVVSLRGSTPAASSVERVVFPVQCACLLLLPFMADEAAFQGVMVLLIADSTAYSVSHWNILVLLAYRKRLKPVYHFGQGLIATALFVAAGWAAVSVPVAMFPQVMATYSASGWGMVGLPSFIAGEAVSLTCVACLAAVFFDVVALSVVPYASNRKVEDLFGAGGDAPEDPAVDPWQEACERICDEKHLTPREREVFAYLTRGRNAEHIAGELFISAHTVKTHTARIYRKLEVNSQQQLIDMVEKAVR